MEYSLIHISVFLLKHSQTYLQFDSYFSLHTCSLAFYSSNTGNFVHITQLVFDLKEFLICSVKIHRWFRVSHTLTLLLCDEYSAGKNMFTFYISINENVLLRICMGVSLSKFVGFRIVKCNTGKKSLRPVCFLFRHYTLQLLNQEATVHLFWTLVSFNESKTNRADNHYIAGNDFQDYSPSYSQKRLVCNFSSEYPIHCSTDGENTQIINQRILYWFRPKFS